VRISLLAAALSILFLSGCAERYNPAAAESVTKWWRETFHGHAVERAGAVTEPHTIVARNGRVFNIKRHVQTKQEEQAETDDSTVMAYEGSLVTGFEVKGNTVLVHSHLTSAKLNDAQQICHDLGGWVWAKDNRSFGVENIKVLGSSGEILSYRYGLQGNVY